MIVPVTVAIYNNFDNQSSKNFSLVLHSEEAAARIISGTTVVYIFDDDCELAIKPQDKTLCACVIHLMTLFSLHEYNIIVPPPTIQIIGPMNIVDGESATFICTATSSFSDNITVSWLDDGGESVKIKYCVLDIHNTTVSLKR